MMHVLIVLSMILFCALALPAAPVEANHCAAMPDAYQQANCEIGHQKASGIVGGESLLLIWAMFLNIQDRLGV
jgi:hypothetical protein